MDIIFVITHLVMLFCTIGVLYIGMTSENDCENEIKNPLGRPVVPIVKRSFLHFKDRYVQQDVTFQRARDKAEQVRHDLVLHLRVLESYQHGNEQAMGGCWQGKDNFVRLMFGQELRELG